VLVVDDESDARELLRFVLEGCDAIVTTVSSVAEALAIIPEAKPEIIVSDVGMPDEDGYSFIRKLRARPREEGGRIPAIALTAYARPEDRTRALVAGFQSHAAKPIDPQELLVVVANLAGRYS
jgi:CheY-like chemotaxis protein